MARSKLYSAEQPFPIRWTLWLYEFCASLKLAVVLISSVAAVLAIATFVESNTGTAGVQWYVYQSPLFLWLLALLAVNVFCAAAIRYPWKRHQTGFVITHIGLLTLLAGSAVSYLKAVNSQMLVYEHQTSDTAVDHDHGYLFIDGLPGRPETLRYPVKLGPFNWKDLRPSEPWRRAATLVGFDNFPAPWSHPPRLVYGHGDTKVEIVDYYSRSEVRRVPFLKLNFKQVVQGFELPLDVEFNQKLGFGQADFQGLGSVMLWRTSNAEQFRGFPECKPDQTVSGDGAVALWYNGEAYTFPISKLRASQAEKKPIPLNDGLSVELVQYAPAADLNRLLAEGKLSSQGDEPRMPAVELKFYETAGEAAPVGGQNESDKKPAREFQVIRFAQFPFTPNRKGTPDDLVVEFYHPSLSGRIDVLEGPGQQLAYRVWQQKQGRVVAAGNLIEGEPVSTWSMGGGDATWQMTLDRYVPEAEDGATFQVLSLPFIKDDLERGTSRRFKVRMSWKDHGESRQKEFWLKQNLPPPWQPAESAQIVETELPGGRNITTMFRVKETPVGFAMRLDKFDLQVDPGSPIASQYTSHITLFNRSAADVEAASSQKAADGGKTAADGGQEFTISPNAPLDYPDPHGRALRFFQENYLPPRQGEPLGSIFRVNYDPGRWIKYLGCLFVVTGIFTMFYMRAYFFKHPKKPPAPQPRNPVREVVGQKTAV